MDENEILFIDRTIKHIRRVQDNMILLAKHSDKIGFDIDKWELVRCSMKHDSSKFSKELVEGYIITNEYFRNKRLGLSTEHIDLDELKKTWNAHEQIEDHHPEKYNGYIRMDDYALCEMCCDLAAMSQEFNEKDYTQYFIEKLVKEVPWLEVKYEKEHCLTILKLLQELNY